MRRGKGETQTTGRSASDERAGRVAERGEASLGIQFLYGATVTASAIAGLYFLRSWRDTGDRFFAIFAAAFFVLALNWLGLAILDEADETRSVFYLLRWFAFCLIVAAIVDKNRSWRRWT